MLNELRYAGIYRIKGPRASALRNTDRHSLRSRQSTMERPYLMFDDAGSIAAVCECSSMMDDEQLRFHSASAVHITHSLTALVGDSLIRVSLLAVILHLRRIITIHCSPTATDS